MTPEIPSIEAWAKTQGRKPTCRVCRSPLRAEIEKAKADGIPGAIIARWAMAHHPESGIVVPGLQRHFLEHHHEQPGDS